MCGDSRSRTFWDGGHAGVGLKGQRRIMAAIMRCCPVWSDVVRPGFRPGPARLGDADVGITVDARFILSRNPGRPGPSGGSEWPRLAGDTLCWSESASAKRLAGKVLRSLHDIPRSERGHTRRVDLPATFDVPAQLKAHGITRQRAAWVPGFLAARLPGLRARGLPVLLAGLLRGGVRAEGAGFRDSYAGAEPAGVLRIKSATDEAFAIHPFPFTPSRTFNATDDCPAFHSAKAR